jgi:hypothetical protein
MISSAPHTLVIVIGSRGERFSDSSPRDVEDPRLRRSADSVALAASWESYGESHDAQRRVLRGGESRRV